MDITSSLTQLNEAEIAQLFKFVETKYVRYRDVQFELVDHLASGIEEQKQNNPGLSIQQAMAHDYAKFPILDSINW